MLSLLRSQQSLQRTYRWPPSPPSPPPSLFLSPSHPHRSLPYAAKSLFHLHTFPVGKETGLGKSLGEFPSVYSPKEVESGWYEWWSDNDYFKPKTPFPTATMSPTPTESTTSTTAASSSSPPPSSSSHFSMVLPPPNVTGTLHLGHALTVTIQDIFVRWQRMAGKDVVWIPGTDHAGIATQTVVEKKIQKEGLSRHDLGREKFVDRVWEWRSEFGNVIEGQLKKTGASLDWSKNVFTMDETRSNAVNEAFVRLHDSGLIYRSTRIVNWCPTLQSVISDIEVDFEEVSGKSVLQVPNDDAEGGFVPVTVGQIYYFQYPFEDGDGHLEVATTRPETILGDTAVAVHPNDLRYLSAIGRNVVNPLTGASIPVVGDEVLVDPELGTGVVKVTPAHDPNDYACGKRHGLEFITILTDQGRLSPNTPPRYAGKTRWEARDLSLKELEEKGLLVKVKDHAMRIGVCSRSKDILEPMVKPQWYVDCAPLAARSASLLREKQIEILPKEHEMSWYRFMEEDVRDWCVSRQLWWGHRVPAYRVVIDGC
eukprot:TRINITY_DN4101_c0_g1_i1.p1 TRINITY_DN4101_c0_g1~~TRINITY_DN4101_c0_g1_i1.p1  ORF type:complete len:538 (-),score=84.61 TRINITY_DN4101_c0_g1_i1:1837-3450(-)